MIALAAAGQDEQAEQLFTGPNQREHDQLTDATKTLKNVQNGFVERRITAGEELARTASLMTVLCVPIALALMVEAMFLLVRAIARPIATVTQALVALGRGRRAVHVAVDDRRDEVYARSQAMVGPRDITVNLVQPGSTNTEMNPETGEFADSQRGLSPLGRFGQPEDVAAAVAFLATPAARQITGTVLNVDGGALA